jgi:general secretion pathway protein A
MYKSFFHLTRNPFDLTPDPHCFVSTKRHNEALSALYYGVRWHKGFVIVTGEVGTGKTLLLRCLLRLLKESKDIAYAYLFNGRLTPTEFLQYILCDLGLNASGKNKSEMLLDLGQFLVSRGSKKLTTVLIIDEAHLLSEDILEEIRLLSNLETTDDKLLQIVLVGQPELDDKLDSLGLRQLRQRIALRAQLTPLDIIETEAYIEKRLRIAGSDLQGDPIFPTNTVAAVFKYSKGLPRLINTICENGLIAAYAQQCHSVTPEIIEDVAREFRLDTTLLRKDEESTRISETDFRQAANTMLDLFAGLLDLLANPQKAEMNKLRSERAVVLENGSTQKSVPPPVLAGKE